MPKIEFKDHNYRAPAYIQLAAKRKCNDENIFVLGVKDKELKEFQQKMEFHAIEITVPEEKGRAVVAIESRCHANTADMRQASEEGECGSEHGSEPQDWFDDFQITNSRNKAGRSVRSYQLQLSSSTTKGANFNLKLTGAGFFNAITPSGSLSGSYSQTKSKSETKNESTTESFAQRYVLLDTLKVPPKTKVNARITTWAVTYESKTLTEVKVDAKAFLRIRYRTKLSRSTFGGIFVDRVKISAKELFRYELDYKCEDDVVTFKRWGTISHLGEEVQIIKQRDPCSLEEELNRQAVPV